MPSYLHQPRSCQLHHIHVLNYMAHSHPPATWCATLHYLGPYRGPSGPRRYVYVTRDRHCPSHCSGTSWHVGPSQPCSSVADICWYCFIPGMPSSRHSPPHTHTHGTCMTSQTITPQGHGDQWWCHALLMTSATKSCHGSYGEATYLQM